MNNLENKKILITAGSTWVPIDKVRVISNAATGETGITLAEKLSKLGSKVTLILGPVNPVRKLSSLTGYDDRRLKSTTFSNGVKLIRFNFFDELRLKLLNEIRFKKYDIVIHSAAVADYKPTKIYKNKLSSGLKKIRIDLIPTIKIIDLIKQANSSLFVVGFKYKPNTTKDKLIKEANALLKRAKLDLVVANTTDKFNYQAYLVDNNKTGRLIRSKDKLAEELIKNLKDNYV